MAAIFDLLVSVAGTIVAVVNWFIFAIQGTLQILDTAFTVIQVIPHYFFFIPAGALAILFSALGLHILRTIFGR